jgi:hypothetical protein
MPVSKITLSNTIYISFLFFCPFFVKFPYKYRIKDMTIVSEKKIIPIQAKGGATKNQVNVINKMIEGNTEKKERIQKAFNVATLEELTKAQASEVITKLYDNKAM